MPRYIDADALWMDIIHNMDYCDDVLEYIEAQPTADVVERKKGKWTYDMHGYYKCSCCGITTYIPDNRSESYHFCRWCGAEMRGEQDEMC